MNPKWACCNAGNVDNTVVIHRQDPAQFFCEPTTPTVSPHALLFSTQELLAAVTIFHFHHPMTMYAYWH
jgi:hypothetical protein